MCIEESQLFLMSAGRVTLLLFFFWVLPSLQQLDLINHGVHLFCSDLLPREEERAMEENGTIPRVAYLHFASATP